MRRRLLLVVLPAVALLSACSGDDSPAASATPRPSATASPTQVSAEPTSLPEPTATPPQISGLFLEPRESTPDASVSLPPRPASPFQPWDRESVVVYNVEQGTEMNYGPGLAASISPDETRLAYNVQPQVGANQVRIVDLATGEKLQEFEYTGGLASFVDDNYLYLPGGGPGIYDLRSGEKQPLDEVDDPELRAKLEGRAGGTFGLISGDSKYRLRTENWDAACQDKPQAEQELCRANAFESWRLEEVDTGKVVLAFRAYKASFIGAGEFVMATSPRCEAEDGSSVWCADLMEAVRAGSPTGQSQEEVHGTTNIFVVDIATGTATFIATTSFSATALYSWPQNWPLIADQDHIVWTGAYCSQETPGNTMVYDRATGQTTELDQTLWVEFTATGDLGVDPFGPRAILNIDSLDWKTVLPDGVVDVGESSSGRYLYVSGVLGHGGLC